MNRKNPTTVTQTERELTFTRTFQAPRKLVFQAFSTPEHIAQWWGPKDWPVTACTMDFRPGGIWHYRLTGPGGQEHWARAVYQEIVVPKKIVFTDTFADAEGNPAAGKPQSLTTITFTAIGDATKLTSHIQYRSAEDLKKIIVFGMVQGTMEGLDFLGQLLDRMKRKEGV